MKYLLVYHHNAQYLSRFGSAAVIAADGFYGVWTDHSYLLTSETNERENDLSQAVERPESK
jgi:hypothetical protein